MVTNLDSIKVATRQPWAHSTPLLFKLRVMEEEFENICFLRKNSMLRHAPLTKMD